LGKITTVLTKKAKPAGLLALAVLALAFDAVASERPAPPARVDDSRLLNASHEPQNWMIYGGSWSEQHYSPLESIDATNISRLKPAWSFDFDTYRGQEATPVVVDGVMYVSSAWSKVFALDAKTGKPLWSFDPKVPGPADLPLCCDVVNRGVAVYKGKVFVGTIDARLIALDAATGAVAWSVATAPPGSTFSITGAPRVARDKVFIGNGGGEFGGRGFVSAYDTATGKLVWRFYVVPRAPNAKPDGAASDSILEKLARPTWFGDDWYRYGGGGHTWNALTYDPELQQLYLATGNGFPWNREFRSQGKGDNLFISSIVALDADTGAYKWHYQETPGDQWDYDAVQNMTLADLTVAGKPHKVLMHAPKNGFFYVLDRKSGQVLSAEPYVTVTWAKRIDLKTGRPVEAPGVRYGLAPTLVAPGAGGAHNWQPMSFNPVTRLVYIPATESAMPFRAVANWRFGEALFTNIGVDFSSGGGNAAHGAAPAAPAPFKPANFVLAWDPVAQKARWRAEGRGGGILTTAGNLVIQGRTRAGALGELVAFRADNGETLWSYPTPNGISAAPSTYSVGGEQYIAVSSGAGSTSVSGTPTRVRHVGRVVAFKLDGTATFPPEAPPALPANPPATIASAETAAAGQRHYDAYCARCHGFGGASGNVIPDLRRSLLLTNKEAWDQVVLGGSLTDRGMVSWSKFLSPTDAEEIRAYLGETARVLQQDERQ
jgi:quinohemoprotein ethanol dehydrogenase